MHRLLAAGAAAALAALAAGCAEREPAPSPGWDELPPAAGARMFAFAERLCAISPRDAGTPGAGAASRFLAQEIRRIGLKPEADCWTEGTPTGRKTFCNVTAELPGTSGRTVVLGSHYDTKPGIPGFAGANDGASSSAVLLGLMEHLVSSPSRPRDTVLFAFFDGEEASGAAYRDNDGLHGSRRLAAKLAARPPSAGPVAAVVVADMVGDRNLALDIPRNVTPWLTKTALKAALERRETCPPVSIAATLIIDDHVPFLVAGFPALDLIDFEYGSAPGRHDWWHTPEDTMDKLSPESLARTGSLLLGILARIDRDEDEIPAPLRAAE
ncbi:MAG: Zn-dependent exopeptidase M28 [Kiritimatiellae bacterium]|nr:Zn-dependent exopeptidase M28 [Kiritimatiellia bacterium]